MRIRSVLASELGVLQEIERAAEGLFREVGMVEVADDEPFTLDVLEGYRRAGWAWVGCDPEDRPVGYLVAEPVDGALHVEQVSVIPVRLVGVWGGPCSRMPRSGPGRRGWAG